MLGGSQASSLETESRVVASFQKETVSSPQSGASAGLAGARPAKADRGLAVNAERVIGVTGSGP